MKNMTFIWFDDDESRIDDFRAAIEAGPPSGRHTAVVKKFPVGKGILVDLANWIRDHDGRDPDLIMIDHVFNLSSPLGLKGSSIAHILRSRFSTVPIVCITAMLDKKNRFNQEELSEYTDVFVYSELGSNVEDLFAIARDFPKLHIAKNDVRDHLISCLKV